MRRNGNLQVKAARMALAIARMMPQVVCVYFLELSCTRVSLHRELLNVTAARQSFNASSLRRYRPRAEPMTLPPS
jgi:hypothetical protein